MDSLSGDVDQILEGDLSDCDPHVNPLPQLTTPRPAHIVQLPSRFFPRSAAEIYQAVVAAVRSTSASTPDSSTLSSLTPDLSVPSSCRTGYQAGERPDTACHSEQSLVSSLQSRVIQRPGYSSADCALRQGPSTERLDPDLPIQPVLNSLYLPASNIEASFKEASPELLQTISQFKHWRASPLFLMVGAVGVLVAGVLGLWIASAAFNTKLPLDSDAVLEPSANSDTDFLAYLQNALETVNASQHTATQSVAVMPVPAPVEPPLPVPTVNPVGTEVLPKLPGAVAQTHNVIERVFVPIYQNDRPQTGLFANATSAGATAALPPVAPFSAPDTQRRPPISVPDSTIAAALPPVPPTTGISSIPIVPPSRELLPSPGAELAVGAAVDPAATLTDVTPDSELALIGVLNLGERSAALFEIDGSSQRAYVGDRIGLSNWTLVSVDGNNVAIRRNDEVRSVYIGQRF